MRNTNRSQGIAGIFLPFIFYFNFYIYVIILSLSSGRIMETRIAIKKEFSKFEDILSG